MHEFLSTVGSYVISHWGAILALLGGGAGVSVFLQTLIHKTHIDSKKLAYTLVHVFSLVAALADYVLSNSSSLNVLPIYAGLVIAAQTVHRFVVSPIYNNNVLPYLQYEAGRKPQSTAPVLPEPPAEAPAAFE